MANLGGYFAVSYLAERVFTDALEALWRTEWENAHTAAEWSNPTPFGPLQFVGGLSLDKPAIAFLGAANAIEVRLSGVARGDITLAGTAAGGVSIAFAAVVSLSVSVSQEDASDKAIVDLSRFTLDATQLQLTFYDGPLQPNAATALLTADTRTRLADQVRLRAARFLTFRMPTDRVYLTELALMTRGIPGSIVITPLIKLGDVRILDGWMALGIDATSSVGETHGNAALIGPPPEFPPPGAASMPQAAPGPGTLRLLIEPNLALAYLGTNARFAVVKAAESRPNLHPDHNSVAVVFADDAMVLTAVGSMDVPDPFPGTMPFSVNVRIRPFIPKNTNTVYASVKPDVRVGVPLHLLLLGTISDFFGGDAFGELRRANKSQMAVLFGVAVKKQTVPETFGVYASIEGRQLIVRPDLFGIYGEAAVTTAFSEPDTSPVPTVTPRVEIRDRFLQLRLTHRRLIADPTFRVSFRITRASTGLEVASGETWSGSDQPFHPPIDLWDDANVQETAYRVELAAQRPPGTVVTQVVQTVTVNDPLDRSHPFVRWRKTHYFAGGGSEPRFIASAVHKTAIRERCKFCDVRERRFGTPYDMQPIDALPAPEEDGFSTRLCQYCFPLGR